MASTCSDRPDGPRAPKPLETVEQYQRIVDQVWEDEREQVESWTMARREEGVGEPMCEEHNVHVMHDGSWSTAFCAGYLGFKDIGTFVMTIFQNRGCCQAVSGLFRETVADWNSVKVYGQLIDMGITIEPLTLVKILSYLQEGRISLASIESGFVDMAIACKTRVPLGQAHRFLRMCLQLRDYLEKVGINIFLGPRGASTVYSDLRLENEDISRVWTLFQTWYKTWRYQIGDSDPHGDDDFSPETCGWSEQPIFSCGEMPVPTAVLPEPVYFAVDVGHPLHRALVQHYRQNPHCRATLVLHMLESHNDPETVVFEAKVVKRGSGNGELCVDGGDLEDSE